MIKHMTTLTMWPIAPSPMCPIPKGAPSLFSVLTMIPISPHFLLPICQKRCQVVKKMSSYQKDVKLSKRCQMSKSQTHGLWRRFTKKINWHNEVHTVMSIWMSHMMVTKNPQNVHTKCFWTILVTFIFDIKIDINMCESDYVNFFFWTSSIVCVFDFLIFDIFLTTWSFPQKCIIFLKNWLFWKKRTDPLIKNLLEMKYRWLPP